jgi:hypothetical protein
MGVQEFVKRLVYLSDRANIEPNLTPALVAALNNFPLSQRQHIRALAAAIAAGVNNV